MPYLAPRRVAVVRPPALPAWSRPGTRLARGLRAPPPSVLSVTGRAAGLYRVSDAALAGYELHVGVDGPPDLSAPPDATYAGRPHTTGALTPGHTYHFVERRRNRFNLVSQNTAAWVLEIAGDGSRPATKPSAPHEVAAAAYGAGVVRVTARYDYAGDGASQADSWLLYVTTDGSTPDPNADTPVELAMIKADGVARLGYVTSALSEGTVVKAFVRTRRSGTPDVDSESSDVVTAAATLLGPDAPDDARAMLGGDDSAG